MQSPIGKSFKTTVHGHWSDYLLSYTNEDESHRLTCKVCNKGMGGYSDKAFCLELGSQYGTWWAYRTLCTIKIVTQSQWIVAKVAGSLAVKQHGHVVIGSYWTVMGLSRWIVE